MTQSVEHSNLELVELRIPARPEWVALARLAAATVANRIHFSLDDIEDVKIAVAEACAAVIQHDAHGEFIDLTCEALDDALRVRVRDSGRHGVPPPAGAPVNFEEARVAGLGIFVIRSLMDEVTYDVDAHGTDLAMVKRLPTQTGS
jgi:serine/threonine-protein kinase RsbW